MYLFNCCTILPSKWAQWGDFIYNLHLVHNLGVCQSKPLPLEKNEMLRRASLPSPVWGRSRGQVFSFMIKADGMEVGGR